VVVYVPAIKKDVALEGTVYSLEQPAGLASEFGVAISLGPLGEPGLFAHSLIEGNVEWGSNVTLSRPGETGTGVVDYHDFFEINVSPALPLIASRLVFFGNREHEVEGEERGDFITNATNCPGNTTTTLKLTDSEGHTVPGTYTPPIGLTGC